MTGLVFDLFMPSVQIDYPVSVIAVVGLYRYKFPKVGPDMFTM